MVEVVPVWAHRAASLLRRRPLAACSRRSGAKRAAISIEGMGFAFPGAFVPTLTRTPRAPCDLSAPESPMNSLALRLSRKGSCRAKANRHTPIARGRAGARGSPARPQKQAPGDGQPNGAGDPISPSAMAFKNPTMASKVGDREASRGRVQAKDFQIPHHEPSTNTRAQAAPICVRA